ncbi:MAG: hypothetical protein ABJH52_13275 [Henriciella sp.]
MILRRLADAFRRQDWFTVSLEIVIVMIGIFLGLQVNAWNQSRIDRVDEAVFLQALYQDVLELEKNSNELIDLRLAELNAIGSGSDVLFGKTEWRDLTEVECDAISTSHSPGIVATSLPSWTALRDAGRTNIVRNVELRRGLATLTQKRESLDRIMDIAETQGYQLMSMHPELFKAEPIRTELEDAPERTYFTTEAMCDAEAFSQNRAAMNALAGNMNRFSSVINRFGIVPWAEQVTKVRTILEKDIKTGA